MVMMKGVVDSYSLFLWVRIVRYIIKGFYIVGIIYYVVCVKNCNK